MLAIEPILDLGQSVLIVAFRLSGLLLFSPVLAGAALPRQFKIALVVILAAALFPGVDESWQRPQHFSLLTLGQLMVTETLIGAAIGLIASLPIVAAQIGGQIIGQQMGLGLAQIFNPEFETNTGVIDQLMFYTALAVFISLGGLEAIFVAMMNTYDHVPLGAMTFRAVPLELLAGTLSAGFEIAFRIAMPVVSIMVIETVASGVLMKTIPQINVLSVGFALKTMAGLFTMAIAAATMFMVFGEEAERVLWLLSDWTGLGGMGPGEGIAAAAEGPGRG
ncbi:MAG: flagellar biosynthetic protein FliR [Planctomycetota bacterium]